MAGKVVKFVVKTTVAGGLVYFTINLTHGPWSAPPKIARLADSEAFVDHAAIGGYQELESPDVLKETWNKGVKMIFQGLHEAPTSLKDLAAKTIRQIQEKYKESHVNTKP